MLAVDDTLSLGCVSLDRRAISSQPLLNCECSVPVKAGSRGQIDLYTLGDSTVFLMVVNMDSEYSRTFGLPLHYPEARDKSQWKG